MNNEMCYRLAVSIGLETNRDFSVPEKIELVETLLRYALTQTNSTDPYPDRIDGILDRLHFLNRLDGRVAKKAFDLVKKS